MRPCFHWCGAPAGSHSWLWPWRWGPGLATAHRSRGDDGMVAEGPHGQLGINFGTLGWAPYGYYPGFYGFSLRFHPGYGYGEGALGVGAGRRLSVLRWTGLLPPRTTPAAVRAYRAFRLFQRSRLSLQFHASRAPCRRPARRHANPRWRRCPRCWQRRLSLRRRFRRVHRSLSVSRRAISLPTRLPPPPVAHPPGPLPPRSSSPVNADPVRILGIDEESVVDARGMRGMKIWRVYPGSPADNAGLKSG